MNHREVKQAYNQYERQVYKIQQLVGKFERDLKKEQEQLADRASQLLYAKRREGKD